MTPKGEAVLKQSSDLSKAFFKRDQDLAAEISRGTDEFLTRLLFHRQLKRKEHQQRNRDNGDGKALLLTTLSTAVDPPPFSAVSLSRK